MKPNVTEPVPPADADRWLRLVQDQVRSLRFGVVQIVVHDSRVTQIDKTERVRIEASRRDEI